MTATTKVLFAALLALAGLFCFWFAADANPLPALLVFALPPLLLALALWLGWARAPFCAAVLALMWFSHGVMVAWTRPPERQLAQIEIVLALVVVFAASLPGLRARFGGKRD
jgi:uncharacterized membrane protein